jgi:hypothetical protein
MSGCGAVLPTRGSFSRDLAKKVCVMAQTGWIDGSFTHELAWNEVQIKFLRDSADRIVEAY